ncbi:retrotransposon unclassified [Hordeum vulgare]|nr:retrotransposon unclassified [Hordeum vulgare]
MFPGFMVVYGETCHRDHRPVIVCMNSEGLQIQERDNSFCFEARWFQEEGCVEAIREVSERAGGNMGGNMADTLRAVGGRMQKWNREMGELEERLRRSLKKLEVCRQEVVTEQKMRGVTRLRCEVEKLEKWCISTGNNVPMFGG